MRRLIGLVIALGIVFGLTAAPVAAQDPRIDGAFSDQKLRAFGYPEIEVVAGEAGMQAPSTLTEGYYLVTLSADGDNVAYLDIVQPPAGLSAEDELAQMREAAIQDLAKADWVYVGGSNTAAPGEPVSFVIYLPAGDYKVAASYYGTAEGSEEVMELLPLTVTAADPAATGDQASPAATMPVPVADVTLEETDELRYTLSTETVPAGPMVWEIANTGMHHAHHMVMFRGPEGMTEEQIVAEFSGFMSGTPTAAPVIFPQLTWVAYAALQSGGKTIWMEYDLTPGTYAIICFIIDPATGMPHVMSGMVNVFTVA